jgi:endoglucanase
MMERAYGSWNWSMLPNPAQFGWTNVVYVVYEMHEYQWAARRPRSRTVPTTR